MNTPQNVVLQIKSKFFKCRFNFCKNVIIIFIMNKKQTALQYYS